MQNKFLHSGPVSVHRAFVYSACAPGIGDVYAGRRLWGYTILVLFILLSIWLTQALVRLLLNLVNYFLESIYGTPPEMLPQFSVTAMLISLICLYFIWLSAILSATDGAVIARRENNLPDQASVPWAVAIAWFCPGAGQVYMAQRRLGLFLFIAFIICQLFMVPVYLRLFREISDLLGPTQSSLGSGLELVSALQSIFQNTHFSIGELMQKAVKNYAIGDTMVSLRMGPLAADTLWLTPSIGYGLALAGIGWLCPGAGQLLQGRSRIGWFFLFGYLAIRLVLGFAAGQKIIAFQTAETWGCLTVIVQWAAALEAPLRLLGTGSKVT
jgi:hypothetical protein